MMVVRTALFGDARQWKVSFVREHADGMETSFALTRVSPNARGPIGKIPE